MRILVISDIHANLTALEAVLADAGTYDKVICLGDLVGYGPDPNECVDLIHRLPNMTCLLGNHDAASLGQIDLNNFNHEAKLSSEWARDVLTEENKNILSSLPETIIIDDIFLAHGSPRNPVWEYMLDAHIAAINFRFFDTQLCFVGHTHLPIGYFLNGDLQLLEWKLFKMDAPVHIEERAILNPGSVGQPRDHDPRAAYAIYHSEKKLWEPRRIHYDITSVQQRIQKAGLPVRHATRLEQGW